MSMRIFEDNYDDWAMYKKVKKTKKTEETKK